jgi:hypothetical protein
VVRVGDGNGDTKWDNGATGITKLHDEAQSIGTWRSRQ